MSKKHKSFRPNNSKPKAPQGTKVSEPKIKITPDSTIRLVIIEQGALKDRGRNSNAYQIELRDKKRRKKIDCIKASPFLKKDAKEIPHGFYKCNDPYNLPTYHQCEKVWNINSTAVQYFISADGILRGFNINSWNLLPKLTKIKLHLEQLSEGKPFSFEIIN